MISGGGGCRTVYFGGGPGGPGVGGCGPDGAHPSSSAPWLIATDACHFWNLLNIALACQLLIKLKFKHTPSAYTMTLS